MKAPALQKECTLLSGGAPTEGLECSPGQEARAVSSGQEPGFECGGTDRSEPIVAASRPDTCCVYP